VTKVASRVEIAHNPKKRMGWRIDWVSSDSSDFNRDLGLLSTKEELKPFLEGQIPPGIGSTQLVQRRKARQRGAGQRLET
jgi:predicted dithiol-disulfide oxidoreductase (DUF899 family)